VTAIGCQHEPGDVAASGSAPASTGITVGPVPGPQPEPSQVPNPFTNDRAAAGQGRQLFMRFNCAGCHGDHGGGGMGPSLRDVEWLYGSSDAQIFDSIVQGRAHGMPSWGPKLSPDQVWRLVTYLKTLRTSNEPEAPEHF